MAIRVTCPHCAEPLQLDEVLAGSTVRCARCDRPFTSPPAWSIQPHAAPAHAALPPAPPIPPFVPNPWRAPGAGYYPPPSNPLPWILTGVFAFLLIAVVVLGMLFWSWDAAVEDEMDFGHVHVAAAPAIDFDVPAMPAPPQDLAVVDDIAPLAGVDAIDADVVAVQLVLGRYEANHRLNDGDPLDVLQNQPRKVYALEMRGGRRYVIDMTSVPMDAFLRLENAQGLPLEIDDNGGGGRNARITYTPAQTARHRIIATCFKGRGDFRLSIREE